MTGQWVQKREDVLGFLERVPESWWEAFRNQNLNEMLTRALFDVIDEERARRGEPPSNAETGPEVKALTILLEHDFQRFMQGKAGKEEFRAWLEGEVLDLILQITRWQKVFLDMLYWLFLSDVYYDEILEFVEKKRQSLRPLALALLRASMPPSSFTSPLIELLEETAPAYVQGLRGLAQRLRRSSVVINDIGTAVYLGQDSTGRPVFLTARHCLRSSEDPRARDEIILPNGETIPLEPLAVPKRPARDILDVASDWALLTVPLEHWSKVMQQLEPAPIALQSTGDAVLFSPIYQYWDYVLLSTPEVHKGHHMQRGYSGSGVMSESGLVGVLSQIDMIVPAFAFADELRQLGFQVEPAPDAEERSLQNLANYCASFMFLKRLGVPEADALRLSEEHGGRVREKLKEVLAHTRGLPWKDRALRLQEEAMEAWRRLTSP